MSQGKIVVHVTVASASGIRDTGFFGVQAPYVTLTHGNIKRKTQVDYEGGTAPIWDEAFRILYTPGRHMHFQIKNHGYIHRLLIGKLTVHSDELEKILEQEDTDVELCVPVLNFDNKRKGEIQLVIRMQRLHGSQAEPVKKSWYSFIQRPTMRQATSPYKPAPTEQQPPPISYKV